MNKTLIILSLLGRSTDAFISQSSVKRCTFVPESFRRINICSAAPLTDKDIHVGDLLSDLPTPCLLMELSLAERFVKDASSYSLDHVLEHSLQEETSVLDESLFVHTRVICTEERDRTTRQEGSGKSHVICKVDTTPQQIPGGAFLGIGLANHHVGGYYWARGMGIGASLPAHGISFRACSNDDDSGELVWYTRKSSETTTETKVSDDKPLSSSSSSSIPKYGNSNDGKRSEWADFLVVGDTVQLVPEKATMVLNSSSFSHLLGVRRLGRPLGADPIVERIWMRSQDKQGWIVQQ